MTRYGGLVGFGLLATLAHAAPAMGQDIVKLGDYQDWTAYAAGAGADKVCYVVAEPSLRQPGQGERKPVIYITHRPGKKAMGVVMAYAGYAFKPDSEAVLEIGKGKYALFTHRDTAWAADGPADERIVKAMRAGKSMTVKATPAEGQPTADIYSLNGVAAALKRIGEACPTK
ncbi:MAG: invasion associated locus B family protein [Reyranellaceae bacterium]